MKSEDLLKDLLSVAVYLLIEQIRDRGGPNAEDMKRAQETSDILGEHGDILLYGGGKPGECADQFNRTAHAIAVLSFVPGGVTLFGITFDAAEQLKSRQPKGPTHEDTSSNPVDGNSTNQV